jgi:predicted ATPase
VKEVRTIYAIRTFTCDGKTAILYELDNGGYYKREEELTALIEQTNEQDTI